ncbi:hypothetical protein IGI04_014083, partial [Brassica rapa subsp. trilocularis]
FLYINKLQLTSKSKENPGRRFFRYRPCFKWVGKANSEELALLADKQASKISARLLRFLSVLDLRSNSGSKSRSPAIAIAGPRPLC